MRKNFEELMEQNKKVGTFGIKYLDEKLNGILKGDLVLLGARSGAGKSTIADIIATHNAKNGRRVTLISLENFEGDNYLQKGYYIYKSLTKTELSMRKFMSGDFDKDIKALRIAEKKAYEHYDNVNIVNRRENYTVEDLKQSIISAFGRDNSDLIIVDHIDYLDKDTAQENELEHITKLVRTIRDTQYIYDRIPVIAISHLRKQQFRGNAPIIPGEDEFIGSSNKVKESTCVIVFAPDEEENLNSMNSLRSTWCCVRKLRNGGYDSKAAKIFFDTKTGQYGDDFQLYKVNYAGTKVEPINHYQTKIIDYKDYTSN